MNTLSPEITSSLVVRPELADAQREEMYQLLACHFDGVSRGQFERDLAGKNRVILIEKENRLVGFSTLLAYESQFEGQPVSVICSGDTIMAPEAWGTPTLPRAWITSVNLLRESYPRGKYYWLLLTSGFRTYRFLPVFWREFHPCFDASMPGERRRLLAHLASELYGSQFHAGEGIVRFDHPQRLRGELADIPNGRDSDAHVAFFLSSNPGYRNGDELVCLTELSPENLTAAGRRMVQPRAHAIHSHHR